MKMNRHIIYRTGIQLSVCLLAAWGLTRSVPAQDTNTFYLTIATNVNVQALQAAADQGEAKAQYDLARCYERGDGVTQNVTQAVEYMRQAAEQGYAPAQGQLGYYYGRGLGVTTNPAEALKWYQMAAAQSNAVA